MGVLSLGLVLRSAKLRIKFTLFSVRVCVCVCVCEFL